jgi:hypothetical protein
MREAMERVKGVDESEEFDLKMSFNSAKADLFMEVSNSFDFFYWIKSLKSASFRKIEIGDLETFFKIDSENKILKFEIPVNYGQKNIDTEYYIKYDGDISVDSHILLNAIQFFKINERDLSLSYSKIRKINVNINYFFLHEFKKKWEMESVLSS